MIDEGHEVGNHTCSHPSGGIPQIGMQAMFDDVKKLDDRLYNEFGYQMRLFRYPEGVQSERGDVLLKQMGYTPVFWSFCHTDYYVNDQPDPADALEGCVQWLHPGAVYLLHAVSSTNTEILGDFIDRARAEGYEFGLPEDLVTEELY